MPFKLAFSGVYRTFLDADLDQKIAFIGSGKLGFPQSALLSFGMGCDMINVGREAMLAIGCIQAQRCHTGHCPTGVATQNRWLAAGIDPAHKANRFANYVVALRKEVLQLSRACGVSHPSFVSTDQLELVDGGIQSKTVTECFGYRKRDVRHATKGEQENREVGSPNG